MCLGMCRCPCRLEALEPSEVSVMDSCELPTMDGGN